MKRILIANRGEVVLRVLRTARELGMETIVVYSEADKDMEYLNFADEAVMIGPEQASKSYLNIDAIIPATDSFQRIPNSHLSARRTASNSSAPRARP
jgi:acetyl-CoA carboxylase biotin carboxylase subunit